MPKRKYEWLRSLRTAIYSEWEMNLLRLSLFLTLAAVVFIGQAEAPAEFKVSFVNIAKSAGLTHKTIYGDEHKNKYLLETTGCGVAWFDYDNDGWLDLFFVNGTRFTGIVKGQEPTNHLYRNNRNGTFTDVTDKAGLRRTGWGQAVCVGDYDNDSFDDLFVSYFGKNALYKNNGNGTFTDVTDKAGVGLNKTKWGSGSAFLDYDKDGDLDLFVGSYIDFDVKTAPTPETGPCLYKGVMVACGPPGLTGGVNTLYQNNGNGTFTDVSEKSGIRKTFGTYALGVLIADFDNDSWPDIYVANDSAPAALYHNNKDGTFTDIGVESGAAYSGDGKPQAGMGVSAGDFDGDGLLDIFKTNFSGDTSTLYRNLGKNNFDDVTFAGGIGLNTRWLGWGCGFFDPDNDGWLDILLVNGHVYPEVEKLTTEAGYPQRKVLYRNLRNKSFQDVTEKIGGALLEPTAGRGCAFGDFDNDGDVDVVINPVNDSPVLMRLDTPPPKDAGNNWITVKTVGAKSNRSGIGARIKCVTEDRTQMNEVRSGGSYYSQNDLRVHFGLGKASKVKTIEVSWPSGKVDVLKDVAVNQVLTVKE
ncbi:MAG TPA: CRTAC1 family protein [Blastocatellia bacterium]|nr:CRTAC1 family protein [Blastocatellia bacterium]HMY73588.1 CRTAC1 family protein [Blastocatellia bacterium]HMZ22636.1 CRTAC1 family protein [Blastocatellia bacterium]HNG30905.1 CRTAC1 family protein [Blastocatellia bacterium]